MNDQRPGPAMGTPRRGGQEEHDVIDLVGRLTRQGTHLAKEQVALMQAELREAVADLKAAIGALAGSATLGIAGLVVLLMGLAYWLGNAIENVALATIIVGALTLIVAGIMAAGARKKLSSTNLKPQRTIETAEDTPAAATGHLHDTGGHHGR